MEQSDRSTAITWLGTANREASLHDRVKYLSSPGLSWNMNCAGRSKFLRRNPGQVRFEWNHENHQHGVLESEKCARVCPMPKSNNFISHNRIGIICHSHFLSLSHLLSYTLSLAHTTSPSILHSLSHTHTSSLSLHLTLPHIFPLFLLFHVSRTQNSLCLSLSRFTS